MLAESKGQGSSDHFGRIVNCFGNLYLNFPCMISFILEHGLKANKLLKMIQIISSLFGKARKKALTSKLKNMSASLKKMKRAPCI